MREVSILQYNQLLTFLIQECFNGGALHDRLKKKNMEKVQKWYCTEKLLISTAAQNRHRKSPAGFITLEVTAEVRIDASQR